jgi:hypothetical protein
VWLACPPRRHFDAISLTAIAESPKTCPAGPSRGHRTATGALCGRRSQIAGGCQTAHTELEIKY